MTRGGSPTRTLGAPPVPSLSLVLPRSSSGRARFTPDRCARRCRDFDPVLAEALQDLPRWIQSPPHRAVETIASIGIQPSYTEGWEGISPFVTGSVLWSLYSVLRSP